MYFGKSIVEAEQGIWLCNTDFLKKISPHLNILYLHDKMEIIQVSVVFTHKPLNAETEVDVREIENVKRT